MTSLKSLKTIPVPYNRESKVVIKKVPTYLTFVVNKSTNEIIWAVNLLKWTLKFVPG